MSSFPCLRDKHLFSDCPKRILSIDGGGIRGVIALAFLEETEALLAKRSGRGKDFRLCHYFDLIGGTSTGAIIATVLSLGYRVTDIVDLYLNLAAKGFQGSRWHGGIFVPKFRTQPLMTILREYLGELTLGSERLQTGLAIIAKRLDTGSVWVIHNNPRGAYFDPADRHPGAMPNRDLPLTSLIRASTAAPTYFAPELIEVAHGEIGSFVDGGVSPFVDPALQLFMLANLNGYGYCWPPGEDRLLLLSVGTGHVPMTEDASVIGRSSGIRLALTSLRSLMQDGKAVGQTLLQWLGRCPTPHVIDSEIDDPSGDRLAGTKFLHYIRYDIELEQQWFERELGVRLSASTVASLIQMDQPANAMRLLSIARNAATYQVNAMHFPTAFDTLSI